MTMRVPDAEAAYLASVVDRLRDILGDELLAVYPTGSIALDGYTAGRSDIDLIAVTEHRPTEPVLRDIAARLDHGALPCPATGLEFVLYAKQTVQAGGVDAGYALDLNTGRELPPKVGLDPDAGPHFWYPIDRSVTYQINSALFGPAPRALLRPVPFDMLLAVVVESMRTHLAEVSVHGDNAVLNGCRALRFGAEGRWYSKALAAQWACRAVPSFADLIGSAMTSHRAGRAAGHALPTTDSTDFLTEVLHRLAATRTVAPTDIYSGHSLSNLA